MQVQKQSGMTIIELLMVVAIMAILAATMIPLSSNFLQRHYLRNKTNELVNSLQTARLYSILAKDDSQWGVKTTSAAIIFFKGSSYASRDANFDQIYSVPTTMTISPVELVFTKLTGDLNQTAVINLTNVTGEMTVSLNELGVLDVN